MARVLLLALALGCGSRPPAAPTPTPPTSGSAPQVTGTLTLDVEPVDAEVEVDGAARGKASDLRALELAPGPHQIVIHKPGFEIWRGEVALAKTAETIQVRLVPAK